MTKVESIMRTLGQLTREIYGNHVPEDVLSVLLVRPASGLALMMKSAEALKADAENVRLLIDKLPSDLKDPARGVSIENQGPFWIGFYQYMSSQDLSARLGPSDLDRAGTLMFGERWQSYLARALNVGDRRVREWMSEERRIPPGVWADITALLRQRSAEGLAMVRELTESK